MTAHMRPQSLPRLVHISGDILEYKLAEAGIRTKMKEVAHVE